MKPDITEPGSLWRRLTWFIAIWAMSVAALVVVASLVRWAIR